MKCRFRTAKCERVEVAQTLDIQNPAGSQLHEIQIRVRTERD